MRSRLQVMQMCRVTVHTTSRGLSDSPSRARLAQMMFLPVDSLALAQSLALRRVRRLGVTQAATASLSGSGTASNSEGLAGLELRVGLTASGTTTGSGRVRVGQAASASRTA